MERVDIHCPCGKQYETTLFTSETHAIPRKRTEQGGSPCPDCGLLYKKSWSLSIPGRRVISPGQFPRTQETA